MESSKEDGKRNIANVCKVYGKRCSVRSVSYGINGIVCMGVLSVVVF